MVVGTFGEIVERLQPTHTGCWGQEKTYTIVLDAFHDRSKAREGQRSIRQHVAVKVETNGSEVLYEGEH